MKTYAEILRDYQKRQHDTVVDAIATGLTFMDEIVVDAGLLEEAGLMTELTGSICSALPFVIIAVTEGTKVLLGRKPMATSVRDSAYRMVKTGAALGIGGAVAAGAGFWAAIPVTMGVRTLFDHYRSRALTGMRVQGRIDRLRELNASLRDATAAPEKEEALSQLVAVVE